MLYTQNIELLSRVILDDAYREAAAIIEKAKAEAESIRKEGIRASVELRELARRGSDQKELFYNKAKAISLEEFRARSEILNCKENIIRDILMRAEQEFYLLPQHKDYVMILKRLIQDALRHLKSDGREFICRVNERDRILLASSDIESLGESLNMALSLDKVPVEIKGGAILLRSDLRLLYDNSLEAVFERKTQLMRCIISESIFGSGEDEDIYLEDR
ncbi:hypothetical protein JXL19_02650 [bacterium]|nr:hypothetical protein [bacterium]